MKILFLASEVPYPPTDSNRACYYHLFRRLQSRHAITCLALSAGAAAADIDHARAVVKELIVVPFEPRKTPCRRALNLFEPLPFGVSLFRCDAYTRALAALLASGGFDVIVAGNANMLPYTADVLGTPRIAFPQDAWSLYYERRAAKARTPWARGYSRLQEAKARAYERSYYPKFDACILVSERDAEIIRELCPTLPIYLVYSGVDLPPPAAIAQKPRTVVFSGVMDYPPNVDAAVYFVREIWPAIRAEEPGAEFHIVGRSPARGVRALAAQPGVHVAGTVPNMLDYLVSMEVYVCPMRLGSGMKMKIVEALAAALPVVTTGCGAEGMDKLAPGADFVLADGPAAFARAVLELLRDGERRRLLGMRGRRTVERFYTWDENARAWERVFTAVTSARPAAASR